MRAFFERAIANVVRHGDTDIFPYPIENHVFFDKPDETVALLQEMHDNFDNWINDYPPMNEGALAPVNYTGFRWATQIDPIWNLYFLSLVLSVAREIETARIPSSENCVFSYRYNWSVEHSSLWDLNYNWRAFMECSLRKAREHSHVVVCDVSEFYSRLGHHRLENALAHLEIRGDNPRRIRDFLSNFSNTNSFGLPVGGPASRLLSELVLDQVDQLLRMEGIPFCRFSDDYHLFADSVEDGFRKLLSLTEMLQRNQGLQLQKSKTRVMTAAEFATTSPIRLEDRTDESTAAPLADGAVSFEAEPSQQDRARSLLQFSLRYDPYSPTAENDYEQLKREIERFDILGLLRSELAKSRIHISLSRKLVAAIRYLENSQRDQATVSLIENSDLLFPIFSSVLTVIKSVYTELSPAAQTRIFELLSELIRTRSHVLSLDLHLAYAVRVIAERRSPAAEALLAQLYTQPNLSSLVRRDIILVMARWRAWGWLSDRKSAFRGMSTAERHAYIIASYSLRDEGSHWRRATRGELSPIEILIKTWASEKAQRPNWVVPI